MLLARILQSDFVNAQLLRHNIGIAYPAIEESCLIDIVLPVRRAELTKLGRAAEKLMRARAEVRELEEELHDSVEQAIDSWTHS